MMHNDLEYLKQLQSRWKKEQQIIRRKYQISYNMTYRYQSCHEKWTSINKQSTIPRMEKLSEFSKSSSSTLNRNLNLDEINSIDCSSIEQQKSKSSSRKKQYVLLDWTNPLSLRRFIQTIEPNRSLAIYSLQQLHELIVNNQQIEVCHSIIDLTLKSQFSFSQIYIDPSFYSSIENSIPYTQSTILADNTNLHRTLDNIKTIVNLLGVKFDHQSNDSPMKILTNKQRQLILNEQIELIRSKVPYNTFRQKSVLTQQTISTHSNSY